MFDFDYNIFKEILCWTVFSDSDSPTYEIKSDDVYNNVFKHKHLLDLDNYLKNSKFFYPVNEGVLAKWKMYTKQNQSLILLN